MGLLKEPTHLQAHLQAPTSRRSNQSIKLLGGQRASAFLAHVKTFQEGFRIAHVQNNIPKTFATTTKIYHKTL
ncbi:MAG: hypothetical protein AUJ98_07475 [Bacteroidetes bacterium CG2_30_33_31]|nr:MAG: hypothetical protein AUJ98_07475 [Bacteroidetes bacterium CG2_30_33_31]